MGTAFVGRVRRYGIHGDGADHSDTVRAVTLSQSTSNVSLNLGSCTSLTPVS